MKVVLLEDVQNVGKAGEIVNVKDGYGRNFLIKTNKGLPGTKENIAKAEEAQALKKQQMEEERQAAVALAKVIDDTTITIAEKAGEDGKLFGSVTSKDIAEALEAQKEIKVDKRKIALNAPVRNVGRIEVKVKTYAGVEGNLTVVVELRPITLKQSSRFSGRFCWKNPILPGQRNCCRRTTFTVPPMPGYLSVCWRCMMKDGQSIP